MSNDLYFLPIIADALRQAEPKEALKAAFEEIKALGQRPQYEQGFLQFQRFMAEVKKNWERPFQKPEDYAIDVIRWLALQAVGGLLKEDEAKAVLDLIGLDSRWKGEFEKLCQETSESEMPRIPEIIIERNGEHIASISCECLPITKEIGDVKPGQYAVRLDTGRLIWEGELTEQELLWASAFPGQNLDLAADTGEAIRRTTREITLLNGELIIRVFPEVESGCLELKIGGSHLS
jgi:hypothetical protein